MVFRLQNLTVLYSQVIDTNGLSVPYRETWYYYYNGLILPLYPVLCCFKRDFYSVSRGSQDISVLLSLFQYLFISVLIHFMLTTHLNTLQS